MKHKNLEILKANDVLVPSFFTVESPDDFTPVKSFVLDENKKYAVRSSFGNEDGANTSYAGQFDTILNVSKQDLKEAIKKVFDSVNNENVRQYQAAVNAEKGMGGCVIIQEMVDAEVSGVLFTANPLGLLNETVFVVGYGLGDNVVSDKTKTASYYYNVDDDIYYKEGEEGTPDLDKYMIKKLVALGKKIKEIFGYDVDVEFAIKNNHIFVLQARPITTIKTSNPIVLDNSNIVESYPGVSLPLTQDFVKEIYHEIFYNLLVRLTKDKKSVDAIDNNIKDMVDVANWRIYYRISNWYYVLNMLPFAKSIIPVWQNMLGVQNKNVSLPDIPKIKMSTKMNVLKSFFYYMKTAPAHMQQLNEKFSKRYAEYRSSLEREDDIIQLLELYEHIKNDILKDWDITLVNDMYTFLYTHLAGENNKALISNIKNLESMKPVKAMNDLAALAMSSGFDSDVYYELEEDYIEEYGDRCLGELKLETHTYRTHPDMLREHVEQTMISMQNNTLNDNEHVNIDVKLGRNAQRARIGIQNREISRLNRSKLFGITRAIFLKIGLLLFKEGRLETSRDVFYLHLSEIASKADFKELVAERKQKEKQFETIPAYSRLVFFDKIFDKTNSVSRVHIADTTDYLSGIATSSGVVTGEVLVIDNPSIEIDSSDKILVTKSTDPGWVFLIQKAKGIIAEKGSLLSHTAIVSRELHKPAVVNVKDCTKILKTGDIVELNAETGTIKIKTGARTTRG